ncbi:hypothetical protein SL1157_1645 [Ruegeria lacuscaerulensis ITI-1157]|nr:hypothetical protein SL1157_1645 [Ruegeria lacuscaerulensis ITI-1157]
MYAARREAEHIANDLTSFIARRQAGVDAGPYLHNARIALAHLAKALGYDLVEVEPETEPDPLDAETVATREAQTPGYGADALYDAQREAQQ